MIDVAARWSRIAAQLTLLGAFVTALGVYCFKTYLNVVEERAEAPKFRIGHFKDWKDFPDEFTKFFEDRVAWMHLQVRRHARFKLDTWGVSPTPRVWVGEDGWLFYNHEADYTYFPATDPRLPARQMEWATALPEWNTWLAERGIRFLVVIPADKQSIYPEYLPSVERKRVGPTPLDVLLGQLGERDRNLQIVDLRAIEGESKEEGQLYYKTDTHWTPLGQRIGYRATVRALGFEPTPTSAFDSEKKFLTNADLPGKMGYWRLEAEPFDDLKLTHPRARRIELKADDTDITRLDYLDSHLYVHSDEKLPRVVFFHDSFGFSDFLAEHCGRLMSVPSNHLDAEVILREKPDIVILEMVERLFQGIGARRPGDPPRRSLTR